MSLTKEREAHLTDTYNQFCELFSNFISNELEKLSDADKDDPYIGLTLVSSILAVAAKVAIILKLDVSDAIYMLADSFCDFDSGLSEVVLKIVNVENKPESFFTAYPGLRAQKAPKKDIKTLN